MLLPIYMTHLTTPVSPRLHSQSTQYSTLLLQSLPNWGRIYRTDKYDSPLWLLVAYSGPSKFRLGWWVTRVAEQIDWGRIGRTDTIVFENGGHGDEAWELAGSYLYCAPQRHHGTWRPCQPAIALVWARLRSIVIWRYKLGTEEGFPFSFSISVITFDALLIIVIKLGLIATVYVWSTCHTMR
jgi:hypothetical protein